MRLGNEAVVSVAIEVKVGDSGQLTLPAKLSQQMGLRSGDHLVAHVEDGRLVIEKVDTLKQQLKQQFAHLKGQGVIDELIAERRAEVIR